MRFPTLVTLWPEPIRHKNIIPGYVEKSSGSYKFHITILIMRNSCMLLIHPKKELLQHRRGYQLKTT